MSKQLSRKSFAEIACMHESGKSLSGGKVMFTEGFVPIYCTACGQATMRHAGGNMFVCSSCGNQVKGIKQ